MWQSICYRKLASWEEVILNLQVEYQSEASYMRSCLKYGNPFCHLQYRQQHWSPLSVRYLVYVKAPKEASGSCIEAAGSGMDNLFLALEESIPPSQKPSRRMSLYRLIRIQVIPRLLVSPKARCLLCMTADENRIPGNGCPAMFVAKSDYDNFLIINLHDPSISLLSVPAERTGKNVI